MATVRATAAMVTFIASSVSPSSSMARSAKTTDAKPLGPNHARKVVVDRSSPAPIMLSATGTIRTTVRLSSA